MTKGLLHSTWHIGGQFGAAFYIGSALTPTDYTMEAKQYHETCADYRDFVSYSDEDAFGGSVTFYDVQAQLDAHALTADLDERNAMAADAARGIL